MTLYWLTYMQPTAVTTVQMGAANATNSEARMAKASKRARGRQQEEYSARGRFYVANSKAVRRHTQSEWAAAVSKVCGQQRRRPQERQEQTVLIIILITAEVTTEEVITCFIEFTFLRPFAWPCSECLRYTPFSLFVICPSLFLSLLWIACSFDVNRRLASGLYVRFGRVHCFSMDQKMG